jgi:hypothetical protein
MLTRREFLRSTGAGAALAATLRPASAEILSPILSRPIPATGELLPVIGLGGSASFRKAASGTDYSNLGAVFDTLLQGGARSSIQRRSTAGRRKLLDASPDNAVSEETFFGPRRSTSSREA